MVKEKSSKDNGMKVLLYAFILLTLASCAGITKIDKSGKGSPSNKVEKELTNVKFPEPLDVTIKPGEVSLIKLRGPFISDGVLKCGDRDVTFYVIEDELFSFLSETYFSKLKGYQCIYKNNQKTSVVANITVEKKTFPSERLKVDKKRVFLNKKNAARAEREREIKYRAYGNSPKYPLFYAPFDLPIDSAVTSIYGSKRIFNKKKQTQHLGTDYRAAVGEPIKTSNRGRVVISRDFFYTGNTVIIDHGMGIFTTYGHLSKRTVSEGEIISSGTVIGLAGATGRVTGPHLHWGVTVNGLAVDGSSLVTASQEIPEGMK